MRLTTVEKWIGVSVAVIGIVGTGIYKFSQLETRVGQLEQQIQHLTMGPRGQSCQVIVAKLVDRPNDQDLQRLAEKWGCSEMPAAQFTPAPAVKRCPDSGAIVLKDEKCPPYQKPTK